MSCWQLGSLSRSPSSVRFSAQLSLHWAFLFLLLLQARLLPVWCALSTCASYVDRLPCTSRTRTFNVDNGEAVSNPCPNCNVGLQILGNCSSDPFTSLYWSWPFFMFCLLFKMNLVWQQKCLSWPSCVFIWVTERLFFGLCFGGFFFFLELRLLRQQYKAQQHLQEVVYFPLCEVKNYLSLLCPEWLISGA